MTRKKSPFGLGKTRKKIRKKKVNYRKTIDLGRGKKKPIAKYSPEKGGDFPPNLVWGGEDFTRVGGGKRTK